ncbi:50S ribosomal protein L3 [Candidatus Falkowbacteria bacterium CG10_big_fil_rev_8_21_14_0_10_43_10]|uniref:50S ribosomal protein L3 n=1 Tax=Candidatus Falkowbacteria bacterium CG10_big_fil_rev_8_21_14_0_10_43_10 TaxID=1974567 RepID=A0A2H0V4P9_9BACT|nr:MAG: 50S ribosomal protein L3 [Candidatus Falkowbacteria bacterium CG10_big_fil_rev_8_21_14_0_10_43_10]
MRELRIKKEQDNMEIKRGDIVDVSSFNEGDIVQITGTSKGKGFQGVVKRHRFHGGPKSHGHKDQLRMPGSIGAKGPAHVFKGTRMGGQMGNERITTKNLEVVKVDAGQGELYIKGAVPGARNSFIIIQGEGEMEVRSMKSETESAPKEKVEDKEASKQEQVMDEVRE